MSQRIDIYKYCEDGLAVNTQQVSGVNYIKLCSSPVVENETLCTPLKAALARAGTVNWFAVHSNDIYMHHETLGGALWTNPAKLTGSQQTALTRVLTFSHYSLIFTYLC